MIVMKFGGTSVGSGEMIRETAELVKREKRQAIVVVSAMSGITDKLIDVSKRVVDLPNNVVEREVDNFCRELRVHHQTAIMTAVSDLKERSTVLGKTLETIEQLKVALLGVGYLEDLSPKSLDYIMSFGERLSAPIVAAALTSLGVESVALTGFEAGIVTDSCFGRARPRNDLMKKTVKEKLDPYLSKKITPVVTGFIGADENARITTLGRGGSDYTASLIGRHLKVEEVQIWTDVDGIFSTDPKIVKDAKLIPSLSYMEAMDLAYFGAKIIHSKMIEPAMVSNIPVRVLNTFNPNSPGTLVVKKQETAESVIKAVAIAKKVVIINLSGVGLMETPNIAGRLFSRIGGANINIVMISGSSESNLSFVVGESDVEKSMTLLKEEFEESNIVEQLDLVRDIAIITVVGAGMQGAKGIASRVFSTVSEAGANIIMIAQGSSEVNISFIVNESDVGNVVKALHEKFIK
ncbi:MAG: aspartate kinase [Candidatus Altiarchaeota archaeon]|nr:aspartate kinase [Candidatus Altiarchaeota archaeon]